MSAQSTKIINIIDNLNSKTMIEYICDIEGNLEYFLRWLSRSKSLEHEYCAEKHSLTLSFKDSSSLFVFGGDIVDRGCGDIVVVKALLSLKKRYPQRAFFLLGNRDFNKLRFSSELAQNFLLNNVNIYWNKDATLFPAFALSKKWISDESDENALAKCWSDLSYRVQWMLDSTMGCPNTFESRRRELAKLSFSTTASITDQQVTQSFIDSVRVDVSDAWMLQFIDEGQLALRIGPYLFVHGGVTSCNVGLSPDGTFHEKLDDWVCALNTFKERELEAYYKQPTYDEKGVRGGDALMDYGVPGGAENRTVVYSHLLDNGNGKPLDDKVTQYLKNTKVRAIIVGHTPHSDAPLVIQTPPYIAVCADTSYSDVCKLPLDSRGEAFALLRLCSDSIQVEGLLRDKTQHGFTLPLSEISINPSPSQSLNQYVGRQIPSSQAWIKSIVGLNTFYTDFAQGRSHKEEKVGLQNIQKEFNVVEK